MNRDYCVNIMSNRHKSASAVGGLHCAASGNGLPFQGAWWWSILSSGVPTSPQNWDHFACQWPLRVRLLVIFSCTKHVYTDAISFYRTESSWTLSYQHLIRALLQLLYESVHYFTHRTGILYWDFTCWFSDMASNLIVHIMKFHSPISVPLESKYLQYDLILKSVSCRSQGNYTGQLDFCNWLADDNGGDNDEEIMWLALRSG